MAAIVAAIDRAIGAGAEAPVQFVLVPEPAVFAVPHHLVSLDEGNCFAYLAMHRSSSKFRFANHVEIAIGSGRVAV
jgi:hypothetical protein